MLFGLVKGRMLKLCSDRFLSEELVRFDNGKRHIAHIIDAVCQKVFVIVERAENCDYNNALRLVCAVVVYLVKHIEKLFHLGGVVLLYGFTHLCVAVVEEEIIGKKFAVLCYVRPVYLLQLGEDGNKSAAESVEVVVCRTAPCLLFGNRLGQLL